MILDRLNLNANIRYPFADDADLVDVTGTYALPDDFLLDARVETSMAEAPSMRLTAIEDGFAEFTVGASDVFSVSMTGAGEVDVVLPLGAHVWLLFGAGVSIPLGWSGRQTFNSALLPTVVAPERGRRLSSTRGSLLGHDTVLTGMIDVEEGYNCNVFVGGGSFVIGASSGAGMGRPCAPRLPPSVDCQSLIFKINGVGPDSLGRFTLRGGPGVSVVSENGAVRISSTIQGSAFSEPGCQTTE